TFDLVVRPAGMAVNPTTGIVVWVPTADQVGTHSVILRAQDGKGGPDLQSFQVTVSQPNTIPVITSTPGGPAAVGVRYGYQVQARDPEGDPLRYGLDIAPAGMTIDASGLVTWVPAAGQVGGNSVVVRVQDGRGGFVTQSYTLTVVTQASNHAPSVTSTPPG